MYITITRSEVTAGQRDEVETFLADLLPRLEERSGVFAAYHFSRPEAGDTQTIVVWADQEAVYAYRDSDLFEEVQAFEREHGLETTREGYTLTYPGPDKMA